MKDGDSKTLTKGGVVWKDYATGKLTKLPDMWNIKVTCCDCGLVHDYFFEVKRGKLIITVYRNKRATTLTRLKTKYKKQ